MQKIVRNRKEARKFCESGKRNSQKTAYWKEGKKCFRFERLPGEKDPTWQENIGGLWWSKTKTVAQKLGI